MAEAKIFLRNRNWAFVTFWAPNGYDVYSPPSPRGQDLTSESKSQPPPLKMGKYKGSSSNIEKVRDQSQNNNCNDNYLKGESDKCWRERLSQNNLVRGRHVLLLPPRASFCQACKVTIVVMQIIIVIVVMQIIMVIVVMQIIMVILLPPWASSSGWRLSRSWSSSAEV